MRIGGDIKKGYRNPEEWIALVKEYRYSAVTTPVGHDASSEVKQAYAECAKKNNVVIGEVGIWRNLMSPDADEAKQNKEYGKARLALAEELGANCCVNIAGSRGEIWDGFYAENYDDYVYDMIVDTTREIIDSVNPKRTFFTLESMPWMLPDSPDSYLKLIKDIDRKGFAVHLDFTNMINCPQRFLKRDALIEECFSKLGPYIKSIHVKDVIMEKAYPCVIREVMPGKGVIDYRKIVRHIEKLGPETTVFVEHLDTHEEYIEAVGFVRKTAEDQHILVY
ncbi:MAG TPA: TIM barrel protein [Mobilitalea sp.]|nr:TIM barrel protein [Mobilitalea sp.]